MCGRCGKRIEGNSTYCTNDGWALFSVARPSDARAQAALHSLELPQTVGLFGRRRLEKERSDLERGIAAVATEGLEAAEEQAETETDSYTLQRRMGLLAMIGNSWERSNAHFQRAHQLAPDDLETNINYALVMAHRGQVQASLELLQSAARQMPKMPAVWFNLALVALQAQRADIALGAVAALEKLWQDNESLADEYRDDALTARGFALLQQGLKEEAHVALEMAAHRTANVPEPPAAAPSSDENHALAAARQYEVEVEEEPEPIAVATQPAVEREWWETIEEDAAAVAAPAATAVIPSFEMPDAIRADASTRNGAATGGAAQNGAAPEITAAIDDDGDAELGELLREPDADLMNNLAVAEASLGHYARAVARLEAAMRIEPGNTRVYGNLGVAAFEQGQFEDALRYFQIARDIEEYAEQVEPNTYAHLGLVLAALGKTEEAWEALQRASRHERADFDVWYNIGRAAVEAGTPEKGVGFLRRAFAANPNNPDVHAVMGTAYLLRGQMEQMGEAIKHLKRALQLDPKHRTALCNLAMALLEIKNAPAATAIVQQGLKLYPRGEEFIFLSALTTMEAGDDFSITKAATQFHTALKVQPNMIAALYNLALCQFVMGMHETAVEQLDMVTQQDPAFGPAYYLQGVGHAAAKRFDQALSAWLKAVPYEPTNADLQANLGFLYYQKEDYENALSCYLGAHRLAPQDADILACIGLCYGRIGAGVRAEIEKEDLRRAKSLIRAKPGAEDEQRAQKLGGIMMRSVDAFVQSIEMKPNAPVTHSNLGLAYYFQKQVEKAVAQWRVVSRLDARYAASREEDQYSNFDDTQMSLRPLDWRQRTVKLAPILPTPHTVYSPGYNMRAFRPAFSDDALKATYAQKTELEHVVRTLGWIHVRR